jgi:hypothetical protein
MEELATLFERMDRLEENASCIVSIPRLTVGERKEMMDGFLLAHSLPDEPRLKAIVAEENGRTALEFNRTLPADEYQQWCRFKPEYIAAKADIFCNLSRIDLDHASLWTDKKTTRITYNLKDRKSASGEEPNRPKKPWWRFW